MFQPMLATPGDVPRGPQWAHEIKWDGLRALVTVAGGVMAHSRRGLAYNTYPLEHLARAVPDGTVLDGELVVLDGRGIPDFALVAPYAQGTRVRDVVFMPFDVLCLGGEDLTGKAWSTRRAALENLGIDVPGLLPGDGPMLLDAARELGLEGVMSKRVDAVYEQGRRSNSWVKTKVVQHADVVVGSWEEASDARPFGSLGMGTRPAGGGPLVYRGQVGTGWNRLSMLATQALFVPADVSPYAAVPRAHVVVAHWLQPTFVVEIGHAGLSADGLYRHPRFRRVVEDISAADL